MRRFQRLAALLLLTAFVGSGIGLPGFDLLAHHLGSDHQQPLRPHYDPAGGCHNHAEHCVLGVVTMQPQVVGASVSGIQSLAELASRPQAEPAPLPPRAAAIRTTQSRAPPAV